MDKKRDKLEDYALGFIEVPITQLIKADWNYKDNDPNLADKLRENIKRVGQIENVIIRQLNTGYYEVVNGNHRFDVMSELGYEKVMAYNLGAISLAAAQRIAIETNETKFNSDTIKLAALIDEIKAEFDTSELAATMPYSLEQLENFSNLINYDFDQFNAAENYAKEDETKLSLIITYEAEDEAIKAEIQAVTKRYPSAAIK